MFCLNVLLKSQTLKFSRSSYIAIRYLSKIKYNIWFSQSKIPS